MRVALRYTSTLAGHTDRALAEKECRYIYIYIHLPLSTAVYTPMYYQMLYSFGRLRGTPSIPMPSLHNRSNITSTCCDQSSLNTYLLLLLLPFLLLLFHGGEGYLSIPSQESGTYFFKPSNTIKINAELGADRTHVMPQPL